MNVRLYGRTLGHSSHAMVTRGFIEALGEASLLDGVVPLDEVETEETVHAGALAHNGVFTGALSLLRQMRVNTAHKALWAVVAPNSTHIPTPILRDLHESKLICLAPSSWAQMVLEYYDLPTMRVRHGVPRGLQTVDRSVAKQIYGEGFFNVLHLSTSAGQRKGTLELIQAWVEAKIKGYLPDRAKLFCVLDPDARSALTERLADECLAWHESTELLSRWDRSWHEVLNGVHLVCQPSRAEAFGLVPLEALACGVPVLATACTGHAEYMYGAGTLRIPHGEPGPIDDGPGAEAPTVSWVDIMEHLRVAHEVWPSLDSDAQMNAATIRVQWSWRHQLDDFIRELRRQTL